MKCSIKVYRVARPDIAYLKFIMEGYEGIAMIRTLEQDQELVALHVAPGAEKEVAFIMDQLSHEIPLQEITSFTDKDDKMWSFDNE